MENMGVKRRRKANGGWAASEAEAFASEGVKKLSIRYKGTLEANPSNYVLISVGGEAEADNNVREGEVHFHCGS